MVNKQKNSKSSNKKRPTKPILKANRWLLWAGLALLLLVGYLMYRHWHDNSLDGFRATPYNIVHPLVRPSAKPQALLAPATIKTVYNLNNKGAGSGTIAIIDAFDDAKIESDLNVFSKQYGLTPCTTSNHCFEKHKMSSRVKSSSTWAIEVALDVEWAHAISPGAKILLVEALSDRGNDLISAVNYARSRSDVVAVSMSWGGNEFSSETAYETNFTSNFGAVFFASSGDSGHGTSWPAVSANVIGVGGTTVSLNSDGSLASETAWSGSGGGVSSYIIEPSRQTNFNVPSASSHRASPDVSYNGDPNSGFPVYSSVPYNHYSGWFQVGGTSAGAPQWAAIAALSAKTLSANKIYTDAAVSGQTTLRDIVSGSNGSCGFYCTAQTSFDYVTGLGSPLTTSF